MQIFFRQKSILFKNILERPVDRFIKYLKEKGIPPTRAEKESGLGNAYIQNSNNGKGQIGSDILNRITETYPDLDIYWIVTGKGNMITTGQKNTYTLDETIQLSNVSPADNHIPHASKRDDSKKSVTPTVTPTPVSADNSPPDIATRLGNIETLVIDVIRRLKDAGL